MDRRFFLQAGSVLAGLPFVSRGAWADSAAPEHTAVDHAGMDHAAMGHSMAPAAASKSGSDLSLPRGEPLPALQPLANQAAASGQFVGRLAAAPVPVALWGDQRRTTFWAYNDSVPGPLLELWEGDEVEIAFDNRLPQPTTLHWHGMPVPPEQDGNPHDPVPPGGSRRYRFRLPDDCAGSYWYHPHPHGHTAEQAYRGLAGAVIIRSRRDPLRHLPEKHLLLSDLKLDDNGQIAANDMADLHDGREGQFLLINGAWQPQIALARGERQRWRIWNASSSRIIKLALPAHELQLVGSDGGLLAAPRDIDSLLLSPGERAEVVVTGRFHADKPAGLISQPYVRGKRMHAEQTQDETLASVVEHGMRPTLALPATLRDIAPLGTPGHRRRIVLSENMADARAPFLINGRSYDMHRIDGTGEVGRIEEWEVVADAHMDHPFHLHGTQFQVLARSVDGIWEDEPFLAWRDVVNVPAGEMVRLRFVQALPGLRMYHCHILEHEDQGMMAQIDFLPR
ncbi:multicopper oxidase family protein [Vogesella sp. LYT5W]|uniref:Multicopper oxidase family protein n=1 Tax=Vogesella margarita TaxID=2984199 RepID=A0ABT5IKC5_9NEIS|nr:multicopper oxidase family protein [Vogesella margarita]MDC7712967.1 multicopper oxidase family protein [Vogesella margarita]